MSTEKSKEKKFFFSLSITTASWENMAMYIFVFFVFSTNQHVGDFIQDSFLQILRFWYFHFSIAPTSSLPDCPNILILLIILT